MQRLKRTALAAVWVALPYSFTAAAEPLVTWSAGADYTTGKYGGTQSTDILFVPVSGKVETGPWALKLVVPYIRITGPGNVVGAGEDRVTLSSGTTAERRTQAGLGDVVASAFYNVLNPARAIVGVDLGVKVKFGTADRAKGLGTGENDYSLQADLFKRIGAFTPFGSIGYRWYGDPPGVDLHNARYGTAGGSYRFSRSTAAGLEYDFRDRIVDGGGRVSELTVFVTQGLSEGWKLQLYALAGFAKASPDAGAGLALSYSY